MLVRRVLTVLTVGMLGFVTACGGGASPAGDPSTLTVAMGRINVGLDPGEALVTSYLRAFGVGESLARIEPDGTVAPQVAESLENTAPTEWTVTLREGATFQSGAPLDAEAVRASLERSRERNDFAANLLDGLTLTVTDPLTLLVTTPSPAPFLDFTLSHFELQIHNAAAYEGLTEPAGPEDADLTGPYRVTGFATEREVTLERNPNWRGPAPTVERVVVQQVSDPQARTQVALSGQADIVEQLPPDAVAQLESVDGVTLVSEPAANTVAVYLNPASPVAPALADQRVRQALAWAVDRAQVAEIAGEGLTEPASSWLASNPGYPQADEQGYPAPDVERAGRLLDEAGWTLGADGRRSRDGQPLTFRLQTWGTEGPTGEVLQAQWDAIGVDVVLSYVDNALVNQARQRGDWDAQTAAFTTIGDVPSLFAAQIGDGGAINYGGYSDPRVAPLVERAEFGTTEEERTAAVLELNALHAEVVPSIPVHPRPQATAVSQRVTGFVPHPLQYENLVRPDYVLAG